MPHSSVCGYLPAMVVPSWPKNASSPYCWCRHLPNRRRWRRWRCGWPSQPSWWMIKGNHVTIKNGGETPVHRIHLKRPGCLISVLNNNFPFQVYHVLITCLFGVPSSIQMFIKSGDESMMGRYIQPCIYHFDLEFANVNQIKDPIVKKSQQMTGDQMRNPKRKAIHGQYRRTSHNHGRIYDISSTKHQTTYFSKRMYSPCIWLMSALICGIRPGFQKPSSRACGLVSQITRMVGGFLLPQ